MKLIKWILGLCIAWVVIAELMSLMPDFGFGRDRGREGMVRGAEITALHVEAEIGRVRIGSTSGEDVVVNFEAPARVRLIEEIDNGQLNLTIRYPNRWNPLRWNRRNNAYLEVLLPQREFDHITAANNVGSLDVENVSARQIDLRSRVGEVSIARSFAQTIRVQTDVGRIMIRDVEGSLFASSEIGEIQARLPEIRQDIQMDTSIGAILLDLGRQPENATIRANTDLGQSRIFGERSSQEQFGDGQYQVRLSSNIGEINVR